MIFDSIIIGLDTRLNKEIFNNFTPLVTGILHRTIYSIKLVYTCIITTYLFLVNNFCYFFVTIILDFPHKIALTNPSLHYFSRKFVHHYNRIFSDTKKPLVREATELFKNIPQFDVNAVFLDIDIRHSQQGFVIRYAAVPFLVFRKDSHAYQGRVKL